MSLVDCSGRRLVWIVAIRHCQQPWRQERAAVDGVRMRRHDGIVVLLSSLSPCAGFATGRCFRREQRRCKGSEDEAPGAGRSCRVRERRRTVRSSDPSESLIARVHGWLPRCGMLTADASRLLARWFVGRSGWTGLGAARGGAPFEWLQWPANAIRQSGRRGCRARMHAHRHSVDRTRRDAPHRRTDECGPNT